MLKQGDEEATHELWVLLWTYGLNLARRYCNGDEMRAEDVAHEAAKEAFMRIITRGIFQFKFGGSFKGYCRRIVVNEIYRLLKRNAKRHEEVPEDLPDTRRSVNQPEIRELLEPCLDQLTARQRDVIECLYFLELTPAEAAEKLGIARNNVDVIAYRARKKLKQCMEGRGFGSSSDVL